MQTPQNNPPPDQPTADQMAPDQLSPDRYNVSGLVVYIRPDQQQAVIDRLHGIRGVEVHAPDSERQASQGKLVVTVEEEPGDITMVNAITRIHNTPGVISASLVYCQTEFNENTRLDSEKPH